MIYKNQLLIYILLGLIFIYLFKFNNEKFSNIGCKLDNCKVKYSRETCVSNPYTPPHLKKNPNLNGYRIGYNTFSTWGCPVIKETDNTNLLSTRGGNSINISDNN